ncbi:MAG: hypothetical protein J6I55_09815 [Ruminococcus sp.]|nr:hypothetical protein [Ruminococcus sp.]
MKDCNCNFTKDVQANGTATWLFAICAFLLGLILGSCCSCCKSKCCKTKTCKCKKNDEVKPLEDEDYFEEEVEF